MHEGVRKGGQEREHASAERRVAAYVEHRTFF
eukprot:COSAG02_NODE_18562_length_932_cov_0.953181_2_plen_31_part_01